ncbi:LmbE family N-acetylglucosaminyl deacetylase [Streptomyces sp. Ag109_O5-1]|uniref:PIG-L deacetylase family protein n=1 Tax=Streptomyces TaxID=1883 RepID=UPI000F507146|nr:MULTISPECIES: PIG-L family deacetylase [Streptomyces]RPE46153.1 LmbE family N-acetylglucosaminyl deacetylase [Streptomyces sp. Ag109_O5-1]
MDSGNEQTTGISRRSVLAAGALTAGAVAYQAGRAPAASAAARPAIFYSPHQDDDAIGLAGSILEHKAAGRPVFLVLVTNGKNPDLAVRMNADPCVLTTWATPHPCAAGGRHNLNWPTDGTSMIVAGRTAEFMASAKAVGVDKVINFKIVDDGAAGTSAYDKLVDRIEAKVRALAAQYPGASHKFTAGWLERTEAHKACSDVAYRLMNDGTISDVRFNHVYAYRRPWEQRADGAAYVLDIPSAHMDIKRNAIYAYNTWDPSRNLYALGYHSVPELLEPAHADPREFVYTLPSDYRPGTGN